MKLTDLSLVAPLNGETILGKKELGTDGCYLIRGVIKRGDPPRLLAPGAGHEEIYLVVAGRLLVRFTAREAEEVGESSVLHLIGEEAVSVESLTEESVYVAAGGHTGGGHAH